MKIISYRGSLENFPTESEMAFENVLYKGFGVHFGIRYGNIFPRGKGLIIQDDIESSNGPCPFVDFLKLYKRSESREMVLVDICEKGILRKILGDIHECEKDGLRISDSNIYFTDFCSSEFEIYASSGLKILSRATRIEEPIAPEKCHGIFIDPTIYAAEFGCWPSSVFEEWHTLNMMIDQTHERKAFFLSPEVRGFKWKEFWEEIEMSLISSAEAILCTGIPTQVRDFLLEKNNAQ